MDQVTILHLIHWPKSGIVNLVYNQIISKKNSSIKHKVGFFILDKDTKDRFESSGIEVINYNYRPVLFFIALKNVFFDIKTTRPQIVHTHSFLPGLFSRIILIFTKSFKLISSIHNSYPYYQGKNIKDKIKKYLEIGSINRVNTKIICVSQYVKNYLIQHTVINAKLIDVVYLGTIINEESNPDHPDCANRVTIVGRLDKQKRHDLLLSIWDKVVEKIPEAKLTIVGDGSEKEMLVKMVYEKSLVQSVDFLGFREDIPELLRGSNISVLTSSYEGFGLVIIESFLQKRPVIAFDVGPLKEVIDKDCGILVKPFDIDAFAENVVYLLRNPQVSIKLGENGYYKVLNHFNINRMVDEIENIYIKVLTENKST